MDAQVTLGRYDEQMRRNAPVGPGEILERLPHVTRVTDTRRDSPRNIVVFSSFDVAVADDVIGEQIAHYQALDRAFEWKVYGHDHPQDLIPRLAARGFQTGETEALLVLDLHRSTLGGPDIRSSETADGVEIRRVTDPEDLADLVSVQEAVWRADVSDVRDQLAQGLRDEPDELLVYLAYVGPHPVAAAWIHFYPDRDFADLWGGSTLSGHRRRGIYRAMVNHRARDARSRGVRFLAVDAGPMSRPILERIGFNFLTTTVPCTLGSPERRLSGLRT